MFKQYKSPYEPAGSSGVLEQESPARRPSIFKEDQKRPGFPQGNVQEPPPRIFETRPPIGGSRLPENEATPDVKAPLPEAKGQQQVWSHSQLNLPLEQPETTLGEGVVFKGVLNFSRLLRIDGHFEGDLISDGKLIVGPTGVVKSNIRLSEAVIEGVVEGNITAKERVELRGEAKVEGDIEARTLSVDEGVTIMGVVTVRPDQKAEPEASE